MEKEAAKDIEESIKEGDTNGPSFGLTIDLQIDMPSPLRSIESPSHPIRVEIDDYKAHVTLAQPEVALRGDFVLLVQQEDLFTPRVWLDSEKALMLELYPQMSSYEEQRCEFIFLGLPPLYFLQTPG